MLRKCAQHCKTHVQKIQERHFLRIKKTMPKTQRRALRYGGWGQASQIHPRWGAWQFKSTPLGKSRKVKSGFVLRNVEYCPSLHQCGRGNIAFFKKLRSFWNWHALTGQARGMIHTSKVCICIYMYTHILGWLKQRVSCWRVVSFSFFQGNTEDNEDTTNRR